MRLKIWSRSFTALAMFKPFIVASPLGLTLRTSKGSSPWLSAGRSSLFPVGGADLVQHALDLHRVYFGVGGLGLGALHHAGAFLPGELGTQAQQDHNIRRFGL